MSLIQVHSQIYARTERLWQSSSSVLINPQTGNRDRQPLGWIESVDDVMPERDVLRILRILKRQFIWVFFLPLKRGSDQIIFWGLDRQKSYTLRDAPHMLGRWTQHCMVNIGFRICVSLSLLVMWTQSRYTEGKHETRFRGKKDISTKVTKDSVQYC